MLGLPVLGHAQEVMLYTAPIFIVRHLGGRMDKLKMKQPAVLSKCESSYALDHFKKFSDRHLVKGEHDVRMFLDPETNYFAIFCAVCEPRMVDAM